MYLLLVFIVYILFYRICFYIYESFRSMNIVDGIFAHLS